eukprot:TRINITY_DN27444_c0_g1_i1.p1 TRINITY_DN27444_c0_g1~~TRINITY_DN27444_c0_g1_i1.p1  ORF type:complete len:591 (+),score=86.85 TRINITY_DN27444_c0_g1_i1:23-1774(+)
MGSAASLDEASLPSLAEITAAHYQDDFKKRMRKHEEVLARERQKSEITGFQASAHYSRPLMEAKLDSSLGCLDDVCASYYSDQMRVVGRGEVYLEPLAEGGQITNISVLGDSANIACASDEGRIWVYNWREGKVVSQFRDQNPDGPNWGGGTREACRVRRLCSCSEDDRLLASGDDRGYVGVWDLHGPSLAIEARLHEKACVGLRADRSRQILATTGEDCFVILYDLAQEQVRDRAVPAPLTDGSGVPNTCLELGGDRFKDLVLVGGADGKMRLWDAAGGLQRRHTIDIGAVTPTHCLVAPSGWQLLVTASLGDSSFCGKRPDRGGLYVYDLRKLSDGAGPQALITKYASGAAATKEGSNSASRVSSIKSGTSNARQSLKGSILSSTSRMALGMGIGALDVVVAEEQGRTMALCLMDNVVRAFDIGTGQEPKESQVSTPAARGTSIWDFDITEHGEADQVNPCALAAADRYVFLATSEPTMGVWRRPVAGTPYGHADFKRPPLPPLEIRSRCLPLTHDPNAFAEEVLVARPDLRPGAVVRTVQAALQADMQRAGLLRDRPEAPTPCQASGGQWPPESVEGITA